MSPTPRAALVLGAIAVAALIAPLGLVALAALALVVCMAVDAWSVRQVPVVSRSLAPVLSRGVPVELRIGTQVPAARTLRIRQPAPPELVLAPAEGDEELDGQLVARVRGRHVLPALGTRAEGRLGLGAWYHRAGGELETRVYPDLVSARRLALAAREGRLLDPSRRARGPIGLGTEFESVREWAPDDDVRHVNWPATQRMARPMTNQYRLEQARDVVFLIDTGRLMATPLGDRTRLDAALDAVAAVALAADELGDHCGAVAFDSGIRAQLRPRRWGGRDIVQSLFDLQPRAVDSDYEQAFRRVAGGKRALVLVCSDLFDEAAARAMIEAAPVLARRHAMVIATVTDPDIDRLVTAEPTAPADVYAAAAALDLLDSRARAAARLRHAGAQVVEAFPDALAAACVRAYLTAKATSRL
ncbi:MAG: DUF58 domain-containing protein [Solirubrobacteraceae bacterium]